MYEQRVKNDCNTGTQILINVYCQTRHCFALWLATFLMVLHFTESHSSLFCIMIGYIPHGFTFYRGRLFIVLHYDWLHSSWFYILHSHTPQLSITYIIQHYLRHIWLKLYIVLDIVKWRHIEKFSIHASSTLQFLGKIIFLEKEI